MKIFTRSAIPAFTVGVISALAVSAAMTTTTPDPNQTDPAAEVRAHSDF